jgi:hypothetical protein
MATDGLDRSRFGFKNCAIAEADIRTRKSKRDDSARSVHSHHCNNRNTLLRAR